MLYRGQRPGWNDAGDPLAPCALPKGDLGARRYYLRPDRTDWQKYHAKLP